MKATVLFPFSVCVCVALTGSPVLGAGVGVEAEAADTIEAPMRTVRTASPPTGVKPLDGASKAAYIEIPAGAGNPPAVNAGKAVYQLNLPKDGTYVLWARVYWQDECSNSLGIQLDGGPVFSFGQDGTHKAWHWVKSPPRIRALDLKAGAHTLSLLNREDGVCVDQIILSDERRFVPVGIEPLDGPAGP